jgi:hypothetical protein
MEKSKLINHWLPGNKLIMKKLIPILLLLFALKGKSQQVHINTNDTSMSVAIGSFPLTSCVDNCVPVTYQWKNISGNPVNFALTNSSKTIISGFQPGVSKIGLIVTTTTGKVYGDTLTVTFTSPNVPCDSAGIIAAYIKAHPCPVCQICPIIPAPRKVVKETDIYTFTNGVWVLTKQYLYNDGSTQ